VVETGRTLKENGLVELEEIVSCQAMVIVNRVSYRLRLAEVRHLLAALDPETATLATAGEKADGGGV
jgi:ATP phosphoribosyltransferase